MAALCAAATPASSLLLGHSSSPSLSQKNSAVQVAIKHASTSSSSLRNPQSRRLTLQTRRQHGMKTKQKMGAMVATMAPPRPPVEPDTSQSGEPEPSLGMEAVLRTDGGEERKEEEETSGDAFVWRDHWYPISLIEDLDPTVPTPFQLLGRELVVWKDQQGEWRVFVDKCPHRLAPLSVSTPPHPYPYLCRALVLCRFFFFLLKFSLQACALSTCACPLPLLVTPWIEGTCPPIVFLHIGKMCVRKPPHPYHLCAMLLDCIYLPFHATFLWC
jgi:hypothetical protein